MKTNDISVADYLSGERESEVKHEFVEGQVFAMAGASLWHNLITGNLYGLLWNELRGQPCFPVGGDMLLKTQENRYRYPDLQIICDSDTSDDEHVRESPILIVEVLSRSTRRADKTEKRAEYLDLPSVQEYVLIEQDVAEIEVQRRRLDWRSEYYYPGQEITFESIKATLAVEEIYQRVDNEDMRIFLKQLD
ncbi:Uma2 family endonuclease [Leucothrix mucor]|uniref:Uma2 family endonuclease n=1 Tax=Leucothrix mucor TaxID=45248 RepID=UPI0003B5E4C9|nr:Uma2 family endonuclease [Leucothrix mucor]